MNREAIAEFLLALTSPVESARATVGDFMEHAESRGPLWFWTAILRTAGSQTLREWLTEPLRLTVGAFLLWLQLILGMAVFGFALYLLWAIVYVADNHPGLELLPTKWGLRVPLVPPEWVGYWTGVAVLPSIVGWREGAAVAAKPETKGLALGIAVALVWTFMSTVTKLPPSTGILAPLAFLGGMMRTRWAGTQRSLS